MSSRHFPKIAAPLSRRTALAAVVLAALGTATMGASTASARVRAAAVVSVNAPPSVVQTGVPVSFTGSAAPAYLGEHVVLQRLRPHGGWLPIAIGYVVAPGGDFSVTHVFVRASGGVPATLRVKVPRNALTARAFSTPFAITIVRRHHPRVHVHERGRRLAERRRLRLLRREARRLHHRHVVEERRRHHQLLIEERRRHHQQVIEERRRRRQQKLEEARRRREERRAHREAKRKLRSANGGSHSG